MRRLLAPLAATLLVVGAANPAEASEQRIRLTLRDGNVVEGYLLEHAQRTYKLFVNGAVREYSEDDVRRVKFMPIVRITIDGDGESLEEVMTGIGQKAGYTILVDPGIQETVRVRLLDIPWREAVDVVARMTRCEVEEIGTSIYLTRHAKVTLNAQRMNIRTVLQLIAEQTKKNIVVGPNVRGNITLDFKERHWQQALEALAWSACLDVTVQSRDLIRVQRRGLTVGADGEQVLERARRPAKPVFPEPQRPGDEDATVTLDVKDVELSDAMEQIGRTVSRNLLVDPDVRDRITLNVHDTPWREAVEAAARMTGARIEERPGGILLLTKPPAGALRAREAPAQEFFQLLASVAAKDIVISPEVMARIDTRLESPYLVEAIEATATAYGYQVVAITEDLLVIVGERFLPDAIPTPGVAEQVVGAGGQQVKIPRLQALLAFTDSQSSFIGSDLALLGGRVYARGSNLIDANENELPVRITEVRPQGVTLRLSNRDVEVPFPE